MYCTLNISSRCTKVGFGVEKVLPKNYFISSFLESLIPKDRHSQPVMKSTPPMGVRKTIQSKEGML